MKPRKVVNRGPTSSTGTGSVSEVEEGVKLDSNTNPNHRRPPAHPNSTSDALKKTHDRTSSSSSKGLSVIPSTSGGKPSGLISINSHTGGNGSAVHEATSRGHHNHHHSAAASAALENLHVNPYSISYDVYRHQAAAAAGGHPPPHSGAHDTLSSSTALVATTTTTGHVPNNNNNNTSRELMAFRSNDSRVAAGSQSRRQQKGIHQNPFKQAAPQLDVRLWSREYMEEERLLEGSVIAAQQLYADLISHLPALTGMIADRSEAAAIISMTTAVANRFSMVSSSSTTASSSSFASASTHLPKLSGTRGGRSSNPHPLLQRQNTLVSQQQQQQQQSSTPPRTQSSISLPPLYPSPPTGSPSPPLQLPAFPPSRSGSAGPTAAGASATTATAIPGMTKDERDMLLISLHAAVCWLVLDRLVHALPRFQPVLGPIFHILRAALFVDRRDERVLRKVSAQSSSSPSTTSILINAETDRKQSQQQQQGSTRRHSSMSSVNSRPGSADSTPRTPSRTSSPSYSEGIATVPPSSSPAREVRTHSPHQPSADDGVSSGRPVSSSITSSSPTGFMYTFSASTPPTKGGRKLSRTSSADRHSRQQRRRPTSAASSSGAASNSSSGQHFHQQLLSIVQLTAGEEYATLLGPYTRSPTFAFAHWQLSQRAIRVAYENRCMQVKCSRFDSLLQFAKRHWIGSFLRGILRSWLLVTTERGNERAALRRKWRARWELESRRTVIRAWRSHATAVVHANMLDSTLRHKILRTKETIRGVETAKEALKSDLQRVQEETRVLLSVKDSLIRACGTSEENLVLMFQKVMAVDEAVSTVLKRLLVCAPPPQGGTGLECVVQWGSGMVYRSLHRTVVRERRVLHKRLERRARKLLRSRVRDARNARRRRRLMAALKENTTPGKDMIEDEDDDGNNYDGEKNGENEKSVQEEPTGSETESNESESNIDSNVDVDEDNDGTKGDDAEKENNGVVKNGKDPMDEMTSAKVTTYIPDADPLACLAALRMLLDEGKDFVDNLPLSSLMHIMRAMRHDVGAPSKEEVKVIDMAEETLYQIRRLRHLDMLQSALLRLKGESENGNGMGNICGDGDDNDVVGGDGLAASGASATALDATKQISRSYMYNDDSLDELRPIPESIRELMLELINTELTNTQTAMSLGEWTGMRQLYSRFSPANARQYMDPSRRGLSEEEEKRPVQRAQVELERGLRRMTTNGDDFDREAAERASAMAEESDGAGEDDPSSNTPPQDPSAQSKNSGNSAAGGKKKRSTNSSVKAQTALKTAVSQSNQVILERLRRNRKRKSDLVNGSSGTHGGGGGDGAGGHGVHPSHRLFQVIKEEEVEERKQEWAITFLISSILVVSYERLTGTVCLVSKLRLSQRHRVSVLVFLSGLMQYYSNWTMRTSHYLTHMDEKAAELRQSAVLAAEAAEREREEAEEAEESEAQSRSAFVVGNNSSSTAGSFHNNQSNNNNNNNSISDNNAYDNNNNNNNTANGTDGGSASALNNTMSNNAKSDLAGMIPGGYSSNGILWVAMKAAGAAATASSALPTSSSPASIGTTGQLPLIFMNPSTTTNNPNTTMNAFGRLAPVKSMSGQTFLKNKKNGALSGEGNFRSQLVLLLQLVRKRGPPFMALWHLLEPPPPPPSSFQTRRNLLHSASGGRPQSTKQQQKNLESSLSLSAVSALNNKNNKNKNKKNRSTKMKNKGRNPKKGHDDNGQEDEDEDDRRNASQTTQPDISGGGGHRGKGIKGSKSTRTKTKNKMAAATKKKKKSKNNKKGGKGIPDATHIDHRTDGDMNVERRRHRHRHRHGHHKRDHSPLNDHHLGSTLNSPSFHGFENGKNKKSGSAVAMPPGASLTQPPWLTGMNTSTTGAAAGGGVAGRSIGANINNKDDGNENPWAERSICSTPSMSNSSMSEQSSILSVSSGVGSPPHSRSSSVADSEDSDMGNDSELDYDSTGTGSFSSCSSSGSSLPYSDSHSGSSKYTSNMSGSPTISNSVSQSTRTAAAAGQWGGMSPALSTSQPRSMITASMSNTMQYPHQQRTYASTLAGASATSAIPTGPAGSAALNTGDNQSTLAPLYELYRNHTRLTKLEPLQRLSVNRLATVDLPIANTTAPASPASSTSTAPGDTEKEKEKEGADVDQKNNDKMEDEKEEKKQNTSAMTRDDVDLMERSKSVSSAAGNSISAKKSATRIDSSTASTRMMHTRALETMRALPFSHLFWLPAVASQQQWSYIATNALHEAVMLLMFDNERYDYTNAAASGSWEPNTAMRTGNATLALSLAAEDQDELAVFLDLPLQRVRDLLNGTWETTPQFARSMVTAATTASNVNPMMMMTSLGMGGGGGGFGASSPWRNDGTPSTPLATRNSNSGSISISSPSAAGGSVSTQHHSMQDQYMALLQMVQDEFVDVRRLYLKYGSFKSIAPHSKDVNKDTMADSLSTSSFFRSITSMAFQTGLSPQNMGSSVVFDVDEETNSNSTAMKIASMEALHIAAKAALMPRIPASRLRLRSIAAGDSTLDSPGIGLPLAVPSMQRDMPRFPQPTIGKGMRTSYGATSSQKPIPLFSGTNTPDTEPLTPLSPATTLATRSKLVVGSPFDEDAAKHVDRDVLLSMQRLNADFVAEYLAADVLMTDEATRHNRILMRHHHQQMPMNPTVTFLTMYDVLTFLRDCGLIGGRWISHVAPPEDMRLRRSSHMQSALRGAATSKYGAASPPKRGAAGAAGAAGGGGRAQLFDIGMDNDAPAGIKGKRGAAAAAFPSNQRNDMLSPEEAAEQDLEDECCAQESYWLLQRSAPLTREEAVHIISEVMLGNSQRRYVRLWREQDRERQLETIQRASAQSRFPTSSSFSASQNASTRSLSLSLSLNNNTKGLAASVRRLSPAKRPSNAAGGGGGRLSQQQQIAMSSSRGRGVSGSSTPTQQKITTAADLKQHRPGDVVMLIVAANVRAAEAKGRSGSRKGRHRRSKRKQGGKNGNGNDPNKESLSSDDNDGDTDEDEEDDGYAADRTGPLSSLEKGAGNRTSIGKNKNDASKKQSKPTGKNEKGVETGGNTAKGNNTNSKSNAAVGGGKGRDGSVALSPADSKAQGKDKKESKEKGAKRNKESSHRREGDPTRESDEEDSDSMNRSFSTPSDVLTALQEKLLGYEEDVENVLCRLLIGPAQFLEILLRCAAAARRYELGKLHEESFLQHRQYFGDQLSRSALAYAQLAAGTADISLGGSGGGGGTGGGINPTGVPISTGQNVSISSPTKSMGAAAGGGLLSSPPEENRELQGVTLRRQQEQKQAQLQHAAHMQQLLRFHQAVLKSAVEPMVTFRMFSSSGGAQQNRFPGNTGGAVMYAVSPCAPPSFMANPGTTAASAGPAAAMKMMMTRGGNFASPGTNVPSPFNPNSYATGASDATNPVSIRDLGNAIRIQPHCVSIFLHNLVYPQTIHAGLSSLQSAATTSTVTPAATAIAKTIPLTGGAPGGGGSVGVGGPSGQTTIVRNPSGSSGSPVMETLSSTAKRTKRVSGLGAGGRGDAGPNGVGVGGGGGMDDGGVFSAVSAAATAAAANPTLHAPTLQPNFPTWMRALQRNSEFQRFLSKEMNNLHAAFIYYGSVQEKVVTLPQTTSSCSRNKNRGNSNSNSYYDNQDDDDDYYNDSDNDEDYYDEDGDNNNNGSDDDDDSRDEVFTRNISTANGTSSAAAAAAKVGGGDRSLSSSTSRKKAPPGLHAASLAFTASASSSSNDDVSPIPNSQQSSNKAAKKQQQGNQSGAEKKNKNKNTNKKTGVANSFEPALVPSTSATLGGNGGNGGPLRRKRSKRALTNRKQKVSTSIQRRRSQKSLQVMRASASSSEYLQNPFQDRTLRIRRYVFLMSNLELLAEEKKWGTRMPFCAIKRTVMEVFYTVATGNLVHDASGLDPWAMAKIAESPATRESGGAVASTVSGAGVGESKRRGSRFLNESRTNENVSSAMGASTLDAEASASMRRAGTMRPGQRSNNNTTTNNNASISINTKSTTENAMFASFNASRSNVNNQSIGGVVGGGVSTVEVKTESSMKVMSQRFLYFEEWIDVMCAMAMQARPNPLEPLHRKLAWFLKECVYPW